MSSATDRAHRREALEFLGYFVLAGALAGATFWLVQYRPYKEAKWYILACLATAVVSVLYAGRLYYISRTLSRRNVVRPAVRSPARRAAPPRPTRLKWSERLAQQESGSTGNAAPDASPRSRAAPNRGSDAEMREDSQMALDAIKARIAERMRLEDKDKELERRQPGKFSGRP
ncbi:hypothetical protein [Sphingomonas gei]|nr:hypothetical protein [Sphingomonas gei]